MKNKERKVKEEKNIKFKDRENKMMSANNLEKK